MTISEIITTEAVSLNNSKDLVGFISSVRSLTQDKMKKLMGISEVIGLAKTIPDLEKRLPLLLESVSICEGILAGGLKGSTKEQTNPAHQMVDLWSRAESCKTLFSALCQHWQSGSAADEIKVRWMALTRAVPAVLSDLINVWALPKGPEWVQPLAGLFAQLPRG